MRQCTRGRNIDRCVSFGKSIKGIGRCCSTTSIFILPSLCRNLPMSKIRTRATKLPILFSSRVAHRASVDILARFLPVSSTGL